MSLPILEVVAIWLVFSALAIFNGLIRDRLVIKRVGRQIALPLSGVLLVAVILSVTYLALPRLGPLQEAGYLLVGAIWMMMTLIFEYLFGRFVLGKSWQLITDELSPADGNLFILVVLASAAAPWYAAKLRDLL